MHLKQIHTGPGFLGVVADAGRTASHRAHLMLRLARRDMGDIESALAGIGELTALHHVSGEYDLVAVLESAQAEVLEALIARIARMSGISAVMTSHLLSPLSLSDARSVAA